LNRGVCSCWEPRLHGRRSTTGMPDSLPHQIPFFKPQMGKGTAPAAQHWYMGPAALSERDMSRSDRSRDMSSPSDRYDKRSHLPHGPRRARYIHVITRLPTWSRLFSAMRSGGECRPEPELLVSGHASRADALRRRVVIFSVMTSEQNADRATEAAGRRSRKTYRSRTLANRSCPRTESLTLTRHCKDGFARNSRTLRCEQRCVDKALATMGAGSPRRL